MTIMCELQKTHTSASISCGVFGEAIRQLVPGPLDEAIRGVAQTTRPSTAGSIVPEHVQTANLDGFALQPIVTDVTYWNPY